MANTGVGAENVTIPKRISGYFRIVFHDSGILLALIPFAFSLIVFMFQVGRYEFFGVPFRYITLTIGQLFTVWFGLFLMVGIFGFMVLDFTVHLFTKYRLLRLLALGPLVAAMIVGLIFFILDGSLASVYLGIAVFVIWLLLNVVGPLKHGNKKDSYISKIQKYQDHLQNKEDAFEATRHPTWKVISDSYFMIAFTLVLILGIPFRIGYLYESNQSHHWVNNSYNSEIIIDTSDDYYLIKEFDPESKELESGYKIRPVSIEPATFMEIDTGVLSNPKKNDNVSK